MRLILASASPRRAELLTSAGFTFDVTPAHVDESIVAGETPAGYAKRVAGEKAAQVAGGLTDPRAVVLGADTVVVAGDRIFGKPADEAEAEAMLRQLSGRVHDVLTAVVLRTAAGREVSEVAKTRVHVNALTPDEIRWYVASGEPFGKAGAYAIQGRGARFVERIEGSWSNVVGLPIAVVHRLLAGLAAEV